MYSCTCDADKVVQPSFEQEAKKYTSQDSTFCITYFLDSSYESGGPIINGEKNGYWKYFYDAEQIREQGLYKNNLKSEWWEEFYADGIRKAQGTYVNGKRDGYWWFYYSDGSLKQHAEFKNDKIEGWCYNYNESPQLINEGEYHLGVKEGYHKTYKNGNLESEGKYIHNKKWGTWKYYDTDGKLINQENIE